MKCTNEAGTKVLLITFYITKQKKRHPLFILFQNKNGDAILYLIRREKT